MEYYPLLSDLITVDKLPQFLANVQGNLNSLLGNIRLKEYQHDRSPYFGGGAWFLC
ncbi:MAG: hypothetical protein IPN95_01950 [Bacteroidetes bacterium]|nr:hypothetical protein [Bacteroidota bacterium]